MFALVFGLIWLVRKKPFVPMLAWLLHIAIDIPTHSVQFFPTPFLEPISSYVVNGIMWGQPIIFFPNLILLGFGYLFWWYRKKLVKK